MIELLGTIPHVVFQNGNIVCLAKIEGEKKILPLIGDPYISTKLHKILKNNISERTMIETDINKSFSSIDEAKEYMKNLAIKLTNKYENIINRNIERIKNTQCIEAETQGEHENRKSIFMSMLLHGLPSTMDVNMNIGKFVGKELGERYLGYAGNAYMMAKRE